MGEAKLANRFRNADFHDLGRARDCTSLLHLVGSWLERTPGLGAEFDFWTQFQLAVREELRVAREAAEAVEPIALRKSLLEDCAANEENFHSVFCEKKHTELQRLGLRRLSHRATQGAMLISLYR